MSLKSMSKELVERFLTQPSLPETLDSRTFAQNDSPLMRTIEEIIAALDTIADSDDKGERVKAAEASSARWELTQLLEAHKGIRILSGEAPEKLQRDLQGCLYNHREIVSEAIRKVSVETDHSHTMSPLQYSFAGLLFSTTDVSERSMTAQSDQLKRKIKILPSDLIGNEQLVNGGSPYSNPVAKMSKSNLAKAPYGLFVEHFSVLSKNKNFIVQNTVGRGEPTVKKPVDFKYTLFDNYPIRDIPSPASYTARLKKNGVVECFLEPSAQNRMGSHVIDVWRQSANVPVISLPLTREIINMAEPYYSNPREMLGVILNCLPPMNYTTCSKIGKLYRALGQYGELVPLCLRVVSCDSASALLSSFANALHTPNVVATGIAFDSKGNGLIHSNLMVVENDQAVSFEAVDMASLASVSLENSDIDAIIEEVQSITDLSTLVSYLSKLRSELVEAPRENAPEIRLTSERRIRPQLSEEFLLARFEAYIQGREFRDDQAAEVCLDLLQDLYVSIDDSNEMFFQKGAKEESYSIKKHIASFFARVLFEVAQDKTLSQTIKEGFFRSILQYNRLAEIADVNCLIENIGDAEAQLFPAKWIHDHFSFSHALNWGLNIAIGLQRDWAVARILFRLRDDAAVSADIPLESLGITIRKLVHGALIKWKRHLEESYENFNQTFFSPDTVSSEFQSTLIKLLSDLPSFRSESDLDEIKKVLVQSFARSCVTLRKTPPGSAPPELLQALAALPWLRDTFDLNGRLTYTSSEVVMEWFLDDSLTFESFNKDQFGVPFRDDLIAHGLYPFPKAHPICKEWLKNLSKHFTLKNNPAHYGYIGFVPDPGKDRIACKLIKRASNDLFTHQAAFFFEAIRNRVPEFIFLADDIIAASKKREWEYKQDNLERIYTDIRSVDTSTGALVGRNKMRSYLHMRTTVETILPDLARDIAFRTIPNPVFDEWQDILKCDAMLWSGFLEKMKLDTDLKRRDAIPQALTAYTLSVNERFIFRKAFDFLLFETAVAIQNGSSIEDVPYFKFCEFIKSRHEALKERTWIETFDTAQVELEQFLSIPEFLPLKEAFARVKSDRYRFVLALMAYHAVPIRPSLANIEHIDPRLAEFYDIAERLPLLFFNLGIPGPCKLSSDRLTKLKNAIILRSTVTDGEPLDFSYPFSIGREGNTFWAKYFNMEATPHKQNKAPKLAKLEIIGDKQRPGKEREPTERRPTHTGAGQGEYSSLREYSPHDEFRKINWKASSRTPDSSLRVIVEQQPAGTTTPEKAVIINTELFRNTNEWEKNRVDVIAHIAAKLANRKALTVIVAHKGYPCCFIKAREYSREALLDGLSQIIEGYHESFLADPVYYIRWSAVLPICRDELPKGAEIEVLAPTSSSQKDKSRSRI